MCLAVYVASDQPLPVVAWDEAAPDFYIKQYQGRFQPLRHVTKPYHYYVGSHTGCGCGFLYDGVSEGIAEYETIRRMYQRLARYLTDVTAGAPVELFICWGGDEGTAPTQRLVTTPDELERGVVAFEEGQSITVLYKDRWFGVDPAS